MTDRGKVIKGLECITSCGNDGMRDDCANCIYPGGGDCLAPALRDALTLLKAQEPRVLRVEEVVLLKQNDVVWLEDYNKKDVIPAIVSRMGPMVICIEFALSDRFISVGYDDYGKRWRCWASRPTAEQMEAVEWNA